MDTTPSDSASRRSTPYGAPVSSSSGLVFSGPVFWPGVRWLAGFWPRVL